MSPGYLGEQRRLHLQPNGYGGRAYKRAPEVLRLIDLFGATRVLDYGCGQGTLGRALQTDLGARGIIWRDYDPAVSEFESVPIAGANFFNFITSTDVLEHIEPEYIGSVLDHLRALLLPGGHLYTVISLVETAKTLSDGRQAHILLESEMWWIHAMASHGLELVDIVLENAKPEKQICNLWRPV